jgi:primase-polymerase (primpol)-like protein
VCLTGEPLSLPDWTSPADIQNRTATFHRLHRLLFPDAYTERRENVVYRACKLTEAEVLQKLFSERQGNKWRNLLNGNWQEYYGSPSEADLAVLVKLAFYTGRDSNMMDGIFRQFPISGIHKRGTDGQRQWRVSKWQNENRSSEHGVRRQRKQCRGRQRHGRTYDLLPNATPRCSEPEPR